MSKPSIQQVARNRLNNEHDPMTVEIRVGLAGVGGMQGGAKGLKEKPQYSPKGADYNSRGEYTRGGRVIGYGEREDTPFIPRNTARQRGIK